MLIQSLFIFASAAAASASAVSSDLCIKGCCGLKLKLPVASLALYSTGDLTADAAASITVPLNDPAIACCACDDQSPPINSSGGGGTSIPKFPDGLKTCPQCDGKPGCKCDLSKIKKVSPQEASGSVCPKGQPCHEDCICTLDAMMAFINPSNLDTSTIICPVGECEDHCICRDELLSSLKDVLFPPSRPSTKESDEQKGLEGKDEL